MKQADKVMLWVIALLVGSSSWVIARTPTTQTGVSHPTTQQVVSHPQTEVGGIGKPSTSVSVSRPTTQIPVLQPVTTVSVTKPQTETTVSHPQTPTGGSHPSSTDTSVLTGSVTAGNERTPAPTVNTIPSSSSKTSMSDFQMPKAKDFTAASNLGKGDDSLGKPDAAEKAAAAAAFKPPKAEAPADSIAEIMKKVSAISSSVEGKVTQKVEDGSKGK